MAVLLLILGIVVAACGVGAIGFGIPLSEFTVGTTLMTGGATALVGGFILIGLSAVVTELSRLADATRGGLPARAPQRGEQLLEPAAPGFPATQVPPPIAVSSPRPAAPNIPAAPRSRPDLAAREARPLPTQPLAPSSVDVSAAAIERLRSTLPRSEVSRPEPGPPAAQGEETPLSPNGPPQYAPAARSRPDAATAEPKVLTEERPAAAVDTLKASRLDFLFRAKPAAPAAEPPNFDAIWPADARTATNARPAETVPRSAEPSETHPAATAPVPEKQPEGAQTTPPVAVLKSGVVDGMAYTLYSDGSIEAKLPQGTVRFASVAELRAHIESSS
ncbi:MAG TPA: hypothetical protein VH678_25700 [Xanthobacteraceae bacterium]|jgi:hypothetical protein